MYWQLGFITLILVLYNHKSGSVRNYWVACGPIKRGVESVSKKRQNGGQISQKALRVLFPLQWWNRLLRGEVPSFLTMNCPFIESRNKCFFILYTRFWRSYKLSMEHIRLLQPNTRVVYVVYASFCFFNISTNVQQVLWIFAIQYFQH